MSATDKPALIYTTFANAEEAERIGGILVEERLAACVNVMAPITSIYVWQGKRERGTETPMLVKTQASLAEKAVARVRGLHSYETPAILTLPVSGGSADFLAWIAAQTGAPG